MRQPIQEPARHRKCFAKRGAAGQQGTRLPLSFIRKAKWGTRWVARLCREGSLDVGPLRDPMRAHEVCTQKGASTRTEDVHKRGCSNTLPQSQPHHTQEKGWINYIQTMECHKQTPNAAQDSTSKVRSRNEDSEEWRGPWGMCPGGDYSEVSTLC